MNDKEKLTEILSNMDIPEIRNKINFGNLMWMTRNLGFKNRNHPDFDEAMKLIKKMIKELTA